MFLPLSDLSIVAPYDRGSGCIGGCARDRRMLRWLGWWDERVAGGDGGVDCIGDYNAKVAVV